MPSRHYVGQSFTTSLFSESRREHCLSCRRFEPSAATPPPPSSQTLPRRATPRRLRALLPPPIRRMSAEMFCFVIRYHDTVSASYQHGTASEWRHRLHAASESVVRLHHIAPLRRSRSSGRRRLLKLPQQLPRKKSRGHYGRFAQNIDSKSHKYMRIRTRRHTMHC